MWSFGNLARRHHHNRDEAHVVPSKRGSELVFAGIHKGAAVATAGLAGGINAYKGIPEIKGFAGFDVLGGLVLAGAEFWMLYKGNGGKATAAIGGVSTGLLCHWAAVQGTIWGANKAKSDGGSSTKGWDYEGDDVPPPAAVSSKATQDFNEFVG